MIFIMILISLLVGCGRAEESDFHYEVRPYYSVAEGLQQPLEDYINTLLVNGVDALSRIPKNFKIAYESKEFPHLGVCTYINAQMKRVVIRGDLDKVAERAILYHELGHCLFGMPHWYANRNDDFMDDFLVPFQEFWTAARWQKAFDRYVWSIKNNNEVPLHGE